MEIFIIIIVAAQFFITLIASVLISQKIDKSDDLNTRRYNRLWKKLDNKED